MSFFTGKDNLKKMVSSSDEENAPLLNAVNNRTRLKKQKSCLMFGAIIFMFIVSLIIVHKLNPKPELWDSVRNN